MRENVEVFVEICREGVQIPSYAREGDAGMDVRAAETVVIAPSKTVVRDDAKGGLCTYKSAGSLIDCAIAANSHHGIVALQGKLPSQLRGVACIFSNYNSG